MKLSVQEDDTLESAVTAGGHIRERRCGFRAALGAMRLAGGSRPSSGAAPWIIGIRESRMRQCGTKDRRPPTNERG
jgi:hypothetical protein